MSEKLPEFDMAGWTPRTDLGRRVKNKEVTDIDQILAAGERILEPEIVDALLSNLEVEYLLVGQAKGKFGGGQRRIFKNTQKKTKEGNKPKFCAVAVVGDRNGHVGVGFGKSKETVPAREKAVRQAKLNLFMVRRGVGSWEDRADVSHSIPFAVEGKCGSVKVRLLPAPKGKGLVIEKELAKVLALAGIKDVWSKNFGNTTTKINLVSACESALRKLAQVRVADKYKDLLLVQEGSNREKKPKIETPEEIQAEASE